MTREKARIYWSEQNIVTKPLPPSPSPTGEKGAEGRVRASLNGGEDEMCHYDLHTSIAATAARHSITYLSLSGEQVLYDPTMDVCQAEIAAGIAVGEFLVIESEQMQ